MNRLRKGVSSYEDFCKTELNFEIKLLYLSNYFYFDFWFRNRVRQWLIQMMRVLHYARLYFQAQKHHIQFVKLIERYKIGESLLLGKPIRRFLRSIRCNEYKTVFYNHP